jgi:hypothetical protein
MVLINHATCSLSGKGGSDRATILQQIALEFGGQGGDIESSNNALFHAFARFDVTQTVASPPLTVLWLLWVLCGESWGGAAKTSAVGVLSCTVPVCSSSYCRRHSVHFSQPHPSVRPVVCCQRSCGRIGQHAHQHCHQDHKFAAVD